MKRTRSLVKVIADTIITITAMLAFASGIAYIGLGIITSINS